MKKIIMALLLTVMVLLCCLQVYAADGNVIYSENASGIVFEPGSDRSLTDLFPNFKGILPGDTLTQTVTLKNSAASGRRIDVYLRAHGTDESSAELLSNLVLQATVIGEQGGKELFHAPPSETAKLDTWVFLGTLESGATIDLELSLHVPVEMGNAEQDKSGAIVWEFRVNDFSVDGDNATVFDHFTFVIWLVITICAITILTLILYREKKNKKQLTNAEITDLASGEQE